jgi:hypothetical protein
LTASVSDGSSSVASVSQMRDSQWEEAKRQALRVLTKAARQRRTISYSRFVKRIKAIKLEYHGDPRLRQLLDEISVDEDRAGRGLISALVVEATFPKMPSDGFFELAAPRHPPGTKRQRIFETEHDAVYEAHAPETSRGRSPGTRREGA